MHNQHVFLHTYLDTYTYRLIHVCHIHAYIYMDSHLLTYVHAYIHNLCMHMSLPLYMYGCLPYTCTYLHIHACLPA